LTAPASQVVITEFALPGDGFSDRLLEEFARLETGNPQFGIDWLLNLASHGLEEKEKAVVYVASLTPDNFVALPMKMNSRSGHAASLATFYTSAYSPLVCTDSPERLFKAIFEYLADRGNTVALTLSPLTVEPPLFLQIKSTLEQAGWVGIHSFFCFGNWQYEARGDTWQSYLATRPSQLRNTISRRTRQFLEDNRGTLSIIEGVGLRDEHIEQFTNVYHGSWKRDEPWPDFIPALLRLAARRNWLRLGIATYDGVAVASQIWLVFGGKAYIYKLAYHEDYRRLSPGTVLTAHVMQHVIDRDSVLLVDFLSGDDSFKKQWMTVRRECWGIAAYNNRSLHGRILQIRYILRNAAKRLLKKR